MEGNKTKYINNYKVLVVNIILVCAILFLYIYHIISIKKLEANLNLKDEQIYSLNNNITKLRQDCDNHLERISKYEEQVEFMDNHVAICILNGSGLYHKYGCKKVGWNKSFSFVLYTDKQATNEGFSPCYYCSSLDNTIDSKTEVVYVTNTGSMYHRSNCSYLKSKNPITKNEAIKQGYSACTRCCP